MSIRDHFDTRHDASFNRTIDPQSARRQLHMSFGVIALISLATFVVAFTADFHLPRADGLQAPARLVVQAPHVVHTRQAGSFGAIPSGG